MTKTIEILESLGLPPLPSNSPDAIAALIWAREVLQKHQSTTYAVNDPKGIEELKPVRIGGVDQWLHIRGRNRNNPVLLYLHGGPGFPMIGWGWGDATFRPWEDYFTVVHWDQRQTGKSYYPADETAPLTIGQFISDTEEVIQYLQGHLCQNKLFILGHSWGSVLGMHIAKLHPDWLYAHIGIGQVVNWMDNERVLYKRLLYHAREHNQEDLITKLLSIAPYPNPKYPAESYVENGDFVRKELSHLAGETVAHYFPFEEAVKHTALSRLISPYLSDNDINNQLFGDEVAVKRPPYSFTNEFMAIDLPNQLGCSFEVPIFFFTGSHDYQTPVSLSDQWFGQISAPYKELIHFEESAHIVVNEEPGKMLVALVNKVLPFSQAIAE